MNFVDWCVDWFCFDLVIGVGVVVFGLFDCLFRFVCYVWSYFKCGFW